MAHLKRPVIILSRNEDCVDPSVHTLLVVPTSSRIDLRRANDILLEAGEGGLDHPSIVEVDLLSPVLKEELLDPLGQLRDFRLVAIRQAVARSIDL